MYSMVLMVAMSTSPEAAACHKQVGCTGCSGVVYAGCTGYSHGCKGGLFGGCHGSYSSCYGCGGGLFSGCKKSYGCTGYAPMGCTGYAPMGCTGTVAPPPPVKKDMPVPEKKPGGVTYGPQAPAYITVNVPVDAKITINGANTVSTSTVRVFSTPNMEPGTVHYYTFVAEVVREGKSYTATEKVAVEAGVNAVISLNPNVGAAYASK